eukprot:TRINITY_DN47283_c0_g1_i1.p1 TRINITY_DN47283_c0_g1~~TRINITY_DN47283_c0_g1_i1.p1  ORF type:complete len:519 (+),score=150.71 TRINITY_DN47283_c0_g1_i1:79-1635(+)
MVAVPDEALGSPENFEAAPAAALSHDKQREWWGEGRIQSAATADAADAFDAGSDHGGAGRHEEKGLLQADGSAAAPAAAFDATPLYTTHFLSTFGDRMWQFAVPMLFADLWPETLLPSALFVLGVCVSSFFGMAWVGTWIDATPRLQALKTFIIGEAVAIVASALFFLLLLSAGSSSEDAAGDSSIHANAGVVVCFVLLLASSVCAELMARGGTMALEKDWVVVMAQGDSALQTRLNVRMRFIDLCCKALGPMAYGAISTFLGQNAQHRVQVGVCVLAVWNVFFVPAEYLLMLRIYRGFPALADKTVPKGHRPTPLANLAMGWGKYLSHPVLLASLGYTQLYMTSLSDHDVLGSAFLKTRSVPEAVLGASRGIGTLMGWAGTLAFPFVLRRAGGLERAGTFSVWAFVAVLMPIGIVFAANAASAPYVMLGCIVCSRGALWSFDLAIQQIMQERIAETERGAVNGVHAAMCQLFTLAIAAWGVIFHLPSQFKALVFISLVSVTVGAAQFTRWARRDGAL